MFNKTDSLVDDVIYENLTEEERKKYITARLQAQYVYEKVKAEAAELTKEQNKQIDRILMTSEETDVPPLTEILEKFSLIPPQQNISLKNTANVLAAYASVLGNTPPEEKTPELTNVCKNLAHAHKAISAVDKKGGAQTDNDWNAMRDNLRTLSLACDDFGTADNSGSAENRETVENLGRFAQNRRDSLTLEFEKQNNAFIARMTQIKNAINDFVTIKRSLEDCGFNPKTKNSLSAKPEVFGEALKRLKDIHSFFEKDGNEDMMKNTSELTRDIVTFLNGNPAVKNTCGLTPEEFKSIEAAAVMPKNPQI